jgi:hypothetical protein
METSFLLRLPPITAQSTILFAAAAAYGNSILLTAGASKTDATTADTFLRVREVAERYQ